MTPISIQNGPIILYGYNYNGYLRVGFNKCLGSENLKINKTYKVFKEQAEKMDIQEVPAVFIYKRLPELHQRDYKYRPVFGGIKVVNEDLQAATLGFAAEDSSGTYGFVVSGHVEPNTGNTIYQPSIYFPTGDVQGVGGTYADASWVPFSDVEASIYMNDDKIPVEQYGDPEVGMNIYKSGLSTNITTGVVEGQASEIGHPTFGSLYDQWYGSYSGANGDSGAPVMNAGSPIYNPREIVGIHWGEGVDDCWFSPISGVEQDLDVTPLTR